MHLSRHSRSDYNHWQLHLSRRAVGMVTDPSGDVWLTPREAAVKLGVSVGHIYRLKNRLTHRKGNSSRSRVFFLDSTLFDDYMDNG